MKKFISPVCFLWLCLMPALCFSQDNEWVIGDWNGGYFGEKSKLTKKFDSRLVITKVYGTVFEGVVQCILPTDTTIRLHTRISGRIYPNYLMTKLKEVVYFKDPPGQYTWAKHCFTCDSMKLSIAKRGDSVVLNGERRCDTLCNIIARYSKNIGSVAKKTPAAAKSDRSLTTRTFLEMELAPATTPVPGKTPDAGASKTNVVSTNASGKAPGQQNAAPTSPAGKEQAPKAGAITNISGNAPGQPTAATGPPSGTAPVQQTASRTTASTNQPAQPPGNNPVQTSGQPGPSQNTPAEQASLGHQTPGIDRDNIFNASMPVRSGGVIFARPVLRDSISANYVVAGRSVVTSARFIVYADTAEVILMDNGIVDGDTVSLYYNGQVIVQKQVLKTKPFSIKVPVYRGGTNVLTVYAESLGAYPPNTAYVKLICGSKETSFLLSSTMSKSSSIELYRSDTNSD
jgi:hypothetical protein